MPKQTALLLFPEQPPPYLSRISPRRTERTAVSSLPELDAIADDYSELLAKLQDISCASSLIDVANAIMSSTCEIVGSERGARDETRARVEWDDRFSAVAESSGARCAPARASRGTTACPLSRSRVERGARRRARRVGRPLVSCRGE